MAYRCKTCKRKLSINLFTMDSTLSMCDECITAKRKIMAIHAQMKEPPVTLIINKEQGKPDMFDVEPPKKLKPESPKGSNKKARRSYAK